MSLLPSLRALSLPHACPSFQGSKGASQSCGSWRCDIQSSRDTWMSCCRLNLARFLFGMVLTWSLQGRGYRSILNETQR